MKCSSQVTYDCDAEILTGADIPLYVPQSFCSKYLESVESLSMKFAGISGYF